MKFRIVLFLLVFSILSVIGVVYATPTGNGMLIYDEDAANSQPPHSRTWTPSDLSSEANMRADGTLFEDVNYTLLEAATTRNEYMRAALDASGTLNVEVFNGSNWGIGATAPIFGNFTTSIGTTDDANKAFAIAYEKTSGDGLVVYEDTTTDNKTLKYRTWDGVAWSSEQTLDYSAVAEGGANDQAYWIELQSRTTGSANEIMLGWQDITGDGIYGAIWNGASWEDISLINGAGVANARQTFDVAWEGTSDQGMILYGTGTTTDYSVYDISNSAWADGSGSVNVGGAVTWLRAAGDVDSDYIAAIIGDTVSTTSADISVDMWNGTDWTTVAVPTEDADIDTYGFSQGADVAWEQVSSDRALFAWRDDATAGLTTLRYMVYDISANQFQAIEDGTVCLNTEGGTGSVEVVTGLANAEDSAGPCTGAGTWAGTVSGIRLSPDPSSADIMVLAANETTLDIRPEAQLWNGDANGSWLTQTATMGAFETDASPGALPAASTPFRAYQFAWRTSGADNTGLLVYDEDGANVNQPPHYRTWSGTDFSAESNQIDYLTNTSSEDMFSRVEAATTRDEYLAGRLTSDGHLNVQVWDGDSWEYGTNAPDLGTFTINVQSTNALYRSFDIAYEATSGDGLVVYEDSATADGHLKYRTWDGSSWSSEQDLDYSAVDESANVAGWVELETRNSGNEIMLGWVDQANDTVFGAVWDGGTWLNISSINVAGVTSTQKYFDIAWEGTSDQGMIVYGTGTTTDYSVYDISAATWTDGSSSGNPGEVVNWLNLAGDPSSDYIAMIITSGNSTSTSDVAVDMWNGTNWTTVSTPTDDTDIDTYGFANGADVAWEQASSDRALFVWRDDATAGLTTLRYMVYDISANQFQAIEDGTVCLNTEGGTGSVEVVTGLANAEDSAGPCTGAGTWAGTVSGIRLIPDPSSKIIAVLGENETTLDVRPEMQLWNGDANGSWLTQTANMGAFETDASLGSLPTATIPTQPYSFAFNKSSGVTNPVYTQNSYRWYVDSDNENVTDPWSSFSNVDLAENTSIVVIPARYDPPGPSQELRLRINITVGSATITSNTKYFKLQFRTGTDVDCSTGSWTDVGSGAWSYATSTVTDGSTLSTAKITGTDVLEAYSKAKPATNPNSTGSADQDIEYDFHIVGTSSAQNTRYLMRVVETDSGGTASTPFTTYTNCAILTTEPGTSDLMRHGNVFSEGVEQGTYWTD